MSETIISVDGLTCDACKATVQADRSGAWANFDDATDYCPDCFFECGRCHNDAIDAPYNYQVGGNTIPVCGDCWAELTGVKR